MELDETERGSSTGRRSVEAAGHTDGTTNVTPIDAASAVDSPMDVHGLEVTGHPHGTGGGAGEGRPSGRRRTLRSRVLVATTGRETGAPLVSNDRGRHGTLGPAVDPY
jgi:hypothetical protein